MRGVVSYMGKSLRRYLHLQQRRRSHLDEQTLLERLIAGRVNAVLDEVLTILETDDGKSFEEKRKKLINFSAQK